MKDLLIQAAERKGIVDAKTLSDSRRLPPPMYPKHLSNMFPPRMPSTIMSLATNPKTAMAS
ncbi:MAG: hypothetical protein ACYTE0_14780 [Planctomycetota bacterium]